MENQISKYVIYVMYNDENIWRIYDSRATRPSTKEWNDLKAGLKTELLYNDYKDITIVRYDRIPHEIRYLTIYASNAIIPLVKNKNYWAKFQDSLHNHSVRTINNVYAHPSNAKIRAFLQCEDFCRRCNGTDGTIIGFSSHTFTYMFEFQQDHKRYIVKMTKDKTTCEEVVSM